MSSKKHVILAGGLVGLLAVLLVHFGNPANMGFCIACFIRVLQGSGSAQGRSGTVHKAGDYRHGLRSLADAMGAGL